MERGCTTYRDCGHEFGSDLFDVSAYAGGEFNSSIGTNNRDITDRERGSRFVGEQRFRLIGYSGREKGQSLGGFQVHYESADRWNVPIMYSSLHKNGFYQTVRMMRVGFVLVTASMVVISFSYPALADTIDGSSATNQYAWGENVGWLVWGTTDGDVFVPDSAADGELTGYAWGENVGWISLNCSNTSSCGTVDYSTDRDQGNITGYAWGENIGWINFNCSNDASCGIVDFGVSVDTASGEFSGYAWGENIGWINFNCSNDASCGIVDFKVVASPTPTPDPDDGGGGGKLITPTPTVTPEPSVFPTPFLGSPLPTPDGDDAPGVDGPPTPPGGGPPDVPPGDGGGPLEAIDKASRRIDDFLNRLGDRPVESGAAVATGIALLPLLWAAVEIVQTKSAGAIAFEFLRMVGLKKRPRVWGIVYNARTKKPIPFARVQVLDEANRILENRFTDRDGRYGFLIASQPDDAEILKVRIVASREGFTFPSRLVKPGTDYIIYENPYFGDLVEVSSQTAFTFDIPLDPEVVAAGEKPARPPFSAVISDTWETVLNIGFYVGLVLVPYNMILHPTALNFVIGALFFGVNAFRVFKMYRPYGHVNDVASGRTAPFSLVTLHNQSGKRLQFAVSDEDGRYFLTTQGENDFQIRVHTPANMIPPRTSTEELSHHSKEIKRGWITRRLKV